ncbi:ABC transporter permease [bacterium]|nr:ABC transporter permease [bacterium]
MQTADIKKQNSFLEGLKRSLRSLPPLTWVVVAMIAFFAIFAPGFFKTENLVNVFRRGSSLWMIATMQTMVLIAGGLDLSLGSMITFAGVVLALLLENGVSAPVAAIAAILSGTGVGTINGFMVSVLGIPAFIVTLGTMNVFGGLAVALTRTSAIFIGDPAMVNFGAGNFLGIPIPILVAILVFGISYLLFYHTSFGRSLIAIGENESGARLSGVNTRRVTWLVFVYASTVAAIAGVVLASRIQSADPTVGVGWEFDAVAASIMGGTLRGKGRGTISSTIIGVVLILVLRNGLNIIGVPVMWRSAIVGLFLLSGIIFDITMRRREK